MKDSMMVMRFHVVNKNEMLRMIIALNVKGATWFKKDREIEIIARMEVQELFSLFNIFEAIYYRFDKDRPLNSTANLICKFLP